MTMDEYLFLLRAELTGRLGDEALEDILRYYTEYFQEAGPEREREVMLELGSPQRLADKILGMGSEEAMVPLDADYIPVPEGSGEQGGLPHWGWLLITLAATALIAFIGLPVLLGLALGGAICLLVGIGLAVGGILAGSLAAGLLLAGGALLTVALGLVLILGAAALCTGISKGVKTLRNTFSGEGYSDEEDR